MFSALPQLSPLEYILLSILGSVVLTFLKAHLSGTEKTDAALSGRISSLEALHYALALKYEGNYNRHDEALENLERNMSNLTSITTALTDAVNRLCYRIDQIAPAK